MVHSSLISVSAVCLDLIVAHPVPSEREQTLGGATLPSDVSGKCKG